MINPKKAISVFEMILMISLSFAIAGLIGDSIERVDASELGTIIVNGKRMEGYFFDNGLNFLGKDGNIYRGLGGGKYVPLSQIPTTQPAGAAVSETLVPGGAGSGSNLIDLGTKSIMYKGKVYEGVKFFRGADGLHYAKLPNEGGIVFDAAKGEWVKANTLPKGVVESGKPFEAGSSAAGGASDIIGGIFGGKALGTSTMGGVIGGALISGAVWGGIVGGAAYAIAKMVGQTPKQAASIGMGLGAGTFVGATLYLTGVNAPAAGGAAIPFLTTQLASFVWGGGVAAAVILLTYKKEKKELIQFQCLPWEAPIGGNDCEKCNKDPLQPCSEYRCKSLGQACEIVNAGSENEMCVWVHPDDTSAPMISPWKDALRPKGELRYVKDTAVRPPARGAKIVKIGEVNGCLQAFTKLEFGITTDEPAKCKIDYELVDGFENMSNWFGNTQAFLYNHTQQLRVPNPFNEEGDANEIPEIHNDGTYTLYTRCMDANGNFNIDAFSFRFCVQPGPDTMQPIIEGTSILDGSPVPFNVDSVPIEVYTNEPAECRWSRLDKAFSDMENKMECATESYEINPDLNYVCSGTLTGIKNRQDNTFYFRCMDYAKENRNVMTESYPLTLKGTEELVITKTGPNGTIKGSTSVATVYLSVETAHGADNGKATCYFDTDESGDFNIGMDFTGGYIHNQSLDLGAGNYRYYFKCVDAGGNAAYSSTEFTIEIDKTYPSVARVYKDSDTLKVVTNEKAKCAYSLTSCDYNLNEGEPLLYDDPAEKTVHYTKWDKEATYYIKCADLQGNEPPPTQCSIIAKGSEL